MILVRKVDGAYEVVDGVTRLRVALKAFGRAEVVDLYSRETLTVHEIGGRIIALTEDGQRAAKKASDDVIAKARGQAQTKVSELTRSQLDYWVARAEGADHERALREAANYRPSENWAQGGPIIERNLIEIAILSGEWAACVNAGFPLHNCHWIDDDGFEQRGPTQLIAAMRAFVASKFGETLPEG